MSDQEVHAEEDTARQRHESETTGDPASEADLRIGLGLPSTTHEAEQLNVAPSRLDESDVESPPVPAGHDPAESDPPPYGDPTPTEPGDRGPEDLDPAGLGQAEAVRVPPHDDLLMGAAPATEPTLNAAITTNDPRGDLRPATLEHTTIVDVTSGAPAGFSAEQTLPTNLDGTQVRSGPNHYGIGDNTPLGEHAGGANSVADVQRDPTEANRAAGPKAGHDALTDTLGRAPGPSTGTIGGNRGAPVALYFASDSPPPPGEELSGSADPDHNMSLFSNDNLRALAGVKPAETTTKKETPEEKFKRESASPAQKDAAELAAWEKKNAGKMEDPDAGGGTVVLTPVVVARVVGVHGGATDVVQDFDGPQIEGDAPPKQAIDFVRDPIERESTTHIDTPLTAPPGVEISHTFNNDGGFDLGRAPSPGPQTGGGDGVGSGNYAHSSDAATAADSSSSDANSVTVVDSASSGAGIHTVADDVTGMTAPSGPNDAVADTGTEQGSTTPVTDVPPVDDSSMALDHLTVSMSATDASPFDSPSESFSGLDVSDDVALPPEIDLDDGF